MTPRVFVDGEIGDEPDRANAGEGEGENTGAGEGDMVDRDFLAWPNDVAQISGAGEECDLWIGEVTEASSENESDPSLENLFVWPHSSEKGDSVVEESGVS